MVVLSAPGSAFASESSVSLNRRNDLDAFLERSERSSGGRNESEEGESGSFSESLCDGRG